MCSLQLVLHRRRCICLQAAATVRPDKLHPDSDWVSKHQSLTCPSCGAAFVLDAATGVTDPQLTAGASITGRQCANVTTDSVFSQPQSRRQQFGDASSRGDIDHPRGSEAALPHDEGRLMSSSALTTPSPGCGAPVALPQNADMADCSPRKSERPLHADTADPAPVCQTRSMRACAANGTPGSSPSRAAESESKCSHSRRAHSGLGTTLRASTEGDGPMTSERLGLHELASTMQERKRALRDRQLALQKARAQWEHSASALAGIPSSKERAHVAAVLKQVRSDIVLLEITHSLAAHHILDKCATHQNQHDGPYSMYNQHNAVTDEGRSRPVPLQVHAVLETQAQQLNADANTLAMERAMVKTHMDRATRSHSDG